MRSIAKKIRLKPHDRKSSQDVCFKIENKKETPGNIVFNDKILGRHKGISHYTVGQRKGLGVAYKEPLYVTALDCRKNIVHVGTRKDTYKKALTADKLNWVCGTPSKKNFRCKAKTRYGIKEVSCKVSVIFRNEVFVEFDKTQASPTPGQAVVFYKGDVVLGGGWIKQVK